MGIRESIEAAKVVSDCGELLERSFQILHNFLRDHIRDQEDWRCLRGFLSRRSWKICLWRRPWRRDAADFLATFVASGGFNPRDNRITIMWKKFNVTALAVLVFGFASAPRSSAGTEIVEDLSAPAPRYNYAPPPPPPPVYYAPAPVGVVVYPTYRYYAPRFAVFGHHR